MNDGEANLPLSGIRVLDFGHTIMGPSCGVILADMGAEVVKIERAPLGDDTRRLKNFGVGFHPYFGRNKKSLAVDLKSEKGREIVYELVKTADVLIENFGPGTIDRLGLGYADCAKLNPRLIYCSLKGFMPGPYENRPALDEVVQMMGGLAYMTGPPGRPLRAGASVIDIMGGTFGALGVITALYERRQTGRGRLVRATLFEAVAFLVGQHMAMAAINQAPPPPMPARGRTWSVYDLFQTADGQQIFVGVTSDRHWARMCQVFGWPDLGADERLKTNNSRIDQSDWFIPELKNRLKKLSMAEIVKLCLEADIPFAPIAKPQDLFDDPHLNQSGGLAEQTMPDGRKAKLPKIPLRIDDLDFGLRREAPKVGEGSREILESIGMGDQEIDQLIKQGVLAVE